MDEILSARERRSIARTVNNEQREQGVALPILPLNPEDLIDGVNQMEDLDDRCNLRVYSYSGSVDHKLGCNDIRKRNIYACDFKLIYILKLSQNNYSNYKIDN